MCEMLHSGTIPELLGLSHLSQKPKGPPPLHNFDPAAALAECALSRHDVSVQSCSAPSEPLKQGTGTRSGTHQAHVFNPCPPTGAPHRLSSTSPAQTALAPRPPRHVRKEHGSKLCRHQHAFTSAIEVAVLAFAPRCTAELQSSILLCTVNTAYQLRCSCCYRRARPVALVVAVAVGADGWLYLSIVQVSQLQYPLCLPSSGSVQLTQS